MIPNVAPQKKTRAMSKRERIKALTPEIRHCLDIIPKVLHQLHDKLGNGIRVNMYLGFTTDLKSRNAFHAFCIRDAKPRLDFIVLAAGRIGKFDEQILPVVFEILESPGWSTNLSQEEYQDLLTLLDCFTLLIDAHYHIMNDRRTHAPYCRHQPITESIPELRKATEYITSKYSNLEILNGTI